MMQSIVGLGAKTREMVEGLVFSLGASLAPVGLLLHQLLLYVEER